MKRIIGSSTLSKHVRSFVAKMVTPLRSTLSAFALLLVAVLVNFGPSSSLVASASPVAHDSHSYESCSSPDWFRGGDGHYYSDQFVTDHLGSFGSDHVTTLAEGIAYLEQHGLPGDHQTWSGDDRSNYHGQDQCSVTVTFVANGGSGTMSPESYTCHANPVALTLNAFTYAGYTFKDWIVTVGEAPYAVGTTFTNGQLISLCESLTIKAEWTPVATTTTSTTTTTVPSTVPSTVPPTVPPVAGPTTTSSTTTTVAPVVVTTVPAVAGPTTPTTSPSLVIPASAPQTGVGGAAKVLGMNNSILVIGSAIVMFAGLVASALSRRRRRRY